MTDLDKRKYVASGTDLNGDLHTFASDDPERALAVFERFQEDLEPITMSEPLERYLATKDA